MRHHIIHLKEHFPFLGADEKDPTLELFLPYNRTEDKKRPVLLILPGGGYSHVSPREGEPIAFHFLPDGYNVFILTYSVKPHVFPSQIREVAAAMELIHQNWEEWACDITRIAILGFSAGGHLAAHYSTCYDCAEVREVFPNSKSVQASILCYPLITTCEEFSHHSCIRSLSGHTDLTQEDLEKFSCELHVSEKTPPAFIWATTEDQIVPVMNSLLYAQALAKYQIPFALHIYPFGKHGLATVDEQTNSTSKLTDGVLFAAGWLDSAKKWLKVTLK